MNLDSPGMWFGQKEFGMAISNFNSYPVKIIFIYLSWPELPNGDLKKVKLEPNTIWDDGVSPPPAEVSIDSFIGDTSIPPFGGSKDLVFFFGNDIQPWGYLMEMEFDNGCSIPPFSF